MQKMFETLNNANIVVFVVNINGIIKKVNPYTLSLTNYSSDDILEQSIDKIIDNKSEFIDFDKKPFYLLDTCQNKVFTKHGNSKWISWTNIKILDKENKIEKIICLGNDISFEKKTTNVLIDNIQQYSDLIEKTCNTIIRFDKKYRHIFVNSNIEKCLGIPAGKVLGKSHAELGFSPDIINKLEQAIEKVFNEKCRHRIEFELNENEWIEWCLIPEYDENKEVETVLTFARSITIFKKAEFDLKNRQEQIEELLKQRTAQLERMNKQINKKNIELDKLKHDLEKNKKRLLYQYESMPISTFVLKKKGDDFELVEYNEAAENLSGGKISHYIEVSKNNFFASDKNIIKNINKAYNDKKLIIDKIKYKLKSSKNNKDLLLRYNYVYPETVILHAEDITEYEKIKKKFHDTKKNYNKLFQGMLEGLAYFEIINNEKGKPIDCKYLDVNNTFERITGLEKEDVIDNNLSEIFIGNNKDKKELIKIIGEVGLSEKEKIFEKYFSYMECWYSFYIFSQENGKVVLSFQDISEHKEIEQALIESESRNRLIWDKTSTGICLTDNNGVYLKVNPAYCEMLGYSKTELIGKRIYDLTVPEKMRTIFKKTYIDKCKTIQDIKNLQNSSNEEVKMSFLRKDSSILITKFGIDYVIKNNRNIYLVYFLNNITERIKAQKDIGIKKKALERAKDKLEKAVKKAEKENKIKTNFLLNVTHDLKSPLASMLSFSKLLLKDDSLNDKHRKTIKRIDQLGNKSLNILDDIYTFSEIMSNKIKVKKINFTFNDILKDVEDFYEYELKKRNMKIVNNVKSLIKIKSDKSLIKKVFSTLISDFLKFSNKGKITVDLNENSENYIISIKNTGFDFGQNEINKIRGILEKENLDIDDTGAISWLNLNLCKDILLLIDGKIWLEEKVNKAPKFYISLSR